MCLLHVRLVRERETSRASKTHARSIAYVQKNVLELIVVEKTGRVIACVIIANRILISDIYGD